MIRIDPPWHLVEDPGFAGPVTRLRVWHEHMGDDDNPAFHEAVWCCQVAGRRVPTSTAYVRAWSDQPIAVVDAAPTGEDVDDGDGTDDDGGLACLHTTPGATLGEIVDASAKQGARLDASFALTIIAPLVSEMLLPEMQRSSFGRVAVEPAISLDHVLVGFDGTSLFRGHLAWWGAHAPPRPRAGMRYAGPLWPRHAAAGALLASVLTSRRVAVGLSLPNVDKAVRDDARALIERLLNGGVVPDVRDDDDDWGDPRARPAPPSDTVTRVSALAARVPADAHAIGAMARALFPARWERERTQAWRG